MRQNSLAADVGFPRQEFSARDFRDTLGSFASGVTVITTRGIDHAHGMTASAFSSVSLDPPLVLCCIGHAAEASEMIEANRVFAVNILSSDQEPISNYFASRDRPRGVDAFKEISHRKLVTGSPIIDGVASFLDCSVHSSYDVGDHRIFVGEVLALEVNNEAKPLLFHGGKYGQVHKPG